MTDKFEYMINGRDMHYKYARCEPSVRGREIHEYHEIAIFLGGKSRLISKEIQQDLKEGDIVLIPKGWYHQFIVTGSDYTRFIIGFWDNEQMQSVIDSVMTEIKLIENSSEATKKLLEGLKEISQSEIPDSEKLLYLRSVIPLLLFEFKKQTKYVVVKNLNISDTVHKALMIIDERFTEKLTVEEIAKELYISPSLLCHKFKAEMNISVYKYISKKRLHNARQNILAGVPITVAAVQSGFADYSCFLKMYKAQFGRLPSDMSGM